MIPQHWILVINDQYGTPMYFGPFKTYEEAQDWAYDNTFNTELIYNSPFKLIKPTKRNLQAMRKAKK